MNLNVTKSWKVYRAISMSAITLAAIAAIATLAGAGAYAFYIAIIFTVIAVHSGIYTEWQYLHHRTDPFLKKKQFKPVAGAT